jgi:SNF2-related domain
VISVIPYIDRMKFPPDDYQIDGTYEVVNKRLFFIADKPGSGKSKQVIDAACILYDQGVIDTVLVVCPAQVKIGWYDADFGEIVKHVWVPSLVTEFTSRTPIIPHSEKELVWAVVSYEFGRDDLYERMLSLELESRKVMFIFDESIRLANWKSRQHKVYKRVAHQRADRIVELNGTPGDPIDMYGQFEILDPSIIGVKNYYHFEARYCIKAPISKGSPIKKVVEFTNRDLLDARIKPYILRREPVLSVSRIDQIVNSAMTERSWRVYKQMRDSMLAWLDDKQATASNAMVKGIRLAQITSGILGGVDNVPNLLSGLTSGDSISLDDSNVCLEEVVQAAQVDPFPESADDETVVEIGDEKIQGLLEWISARRKEQPNLRLLVWARFRAEILRLRRAIAAEGLSTGLIIGGQKKSEREEVIEELTIGSQDKPFIVVGQQQAGGMGLNLITCHYTWYQSNTFSYRDREQTEQRTFRKGQKFNCVFVDHIATGPQGQKTIDHHIVKSLRNQESVARWTMADWRRSLLDE